jgi:FtsZ-binding cell division protein ZapB
LFRSVCKHTAELHSRCERYIKDLVKKDHQLADARKVNKECKEAQTKLELRNQQLENDQQAVQEYIDRLKAGQASTTSVVAKVGSHLACSY